MQLLATQSDAGTLLLGEAQGASTEPGHQCVSKDGWQITGCHARRRRSSQKTLYVNKEFGWIEMSRGCCSRLCQVSLRLLRVPTPRIFVHRHQGGLFFGGTLTDQFPGFAGTASTQQLSDTGAGLNENAQFTRHSPTWTRSSSIRTAGVNSASVKGGTSLGCLHPYFSSVGKGTGNRLMLST